MQIILLSGGSGKRLWPLSNDSRSKQFIKIFKRADDVAESMVQRVYRQIKAAIPSAQITIATSEGQLPFLQNQIGDAADICVEPYRRDTFAAISLSCAFLHERKKLDESEPIVVCPVDPFVDLDFFKAVKNLSELTTHEKFGLFLLGIHPTAPNSQYGYILPKSKETVSSVVAFVEKPDMETAKKLIDGGALWNAGVFAFQLGYILKKTRDFFGTNKYSELVQNYYAFEKISFDYAVTEKERNIQVLRFSGSWDDIGTWNSFSRVLPSKVVGEAYLSDTCKDVNVVNELSMPIVAAGIQNVIISASLEGILVAEKGEVNHIKPLVEQLERPSMVEEKGWGEYRIIDYTKENRIVKARIRQNIHVECSNLEAKAETWLVLQGQGVLTHKNEQMVISTGDAFSVLPNSICSLLANTEMLLIGVQWGQALEWKLFDENCNR